MILGPALSFIWIAAAERLGIRVQRGGDGYVHYDGSTLHIAEDQYLDADDTVAQLILHELCHALVQGPASMSLQDWGLDNTNDGDAARESAAVRLQAHLLGRHGLRRVLFPTTVVRPFFEALPDDALSPASDEDVRLANVAAVRAAQFPMREILRDALEQTASLVGLPLHRKSGFPSASSDSNNACGDCAWRTEGGMCRQASAERRVFVRSDDKACTRFENSLDCLSCGACCRSAFDRVPVVPRDRILQRHPSLVIFDEHGLKVRRSGDRCAALGGPDGGPFACRIYEDRPKTCRDFQEGSNNCLDARRRVGRSA